MPSDMSVVGRALLMPWSKVLAVWSPSIVGLWLLRELVGLGSWRLELWFGGLKCGGSVGDGG